jgi:hypothetical protein
VTRLIVIVHAQAEYKFRKSSYRYAYSTAAEAALELAAHGVLLNTRAALVNV